MKRIALIGAGQLGSRHLQGLAKSDLDISIEVVEPFEGSINIAKQRFEEISSNDKIKEINFYQSIKETSDELDLVIVATNADVRFKVVEELLNIKKVKNLVLEKVLFQRVEEYNKAKYLLNNSKVKCWVNHPRRMFGFYKKLKKLLINTQKINFSVSGGAWGLGCNGLHFLDCFSYLLGSQDINIDSTFLDKKLYKAKRKGCNEINGMLIGEIVGNTFSLNCFNDEVSPVQFNITSNDLNILIDEANGWYRISEKSNKWIQETKEERIVCFQSELTNLLLNDIFNNKCDLPTYDEAMKLHVNYLTVLINHLNSFSKNKFDYCPIT